MRAAATRPAGANDQLSVGIVGIGHRGLALMDEFHKFEQETNARLTAVCDIWTQHLAHGAGIVKEWYGQEPKKFRYLEEMLAWEGLDAVIIATCDFQHAKHLVQCIRAGKDVYCEKPMANVMDEANEALDAVRKSGRIVQNGTQLRSLPAFAGSRKFFQTGLLGKLSKIEQTRNAWGPLWRRKPDQIKESDTDWKAFLMHKPYRPWDPNLYVSWRIYRDFSSGIPDQWMTHFVDMVHYITAATFPKSAVAHGGTYVWKDGRTTADTVHALLEYPEGFLVSYSTNFGNASNNYTKYFGTNGTLDVSDWGKQFISGEGGGGEDQLKEKAPVPAVETVPHMKNWLECLRTRRQPIAPIEAGYAHSVATIMAATSLETGRRVVYDPSRRTISPG